MFYREFFIFYPSRLWIFGGAALALGGVAAACYLLKIAAQPAFLLPTKKSIEALEPRAFASVASLGAPSFSGLLDGKKLQEELSFIVCPSRPDSNEGKDAIRIKSKGSGQTIRVHLPCRIHLAFDAKGVLHLQERPGPFWLDLANEADGKIRIDASAVYSDRVFSHQFFANRQEPLPQKGKDFESNSPMRSLAEAKWIGMDALASFKGIAAACRLEIGANSLDLAECEWVCWKEGRWKKLDDLKEACGAPLAQLKQGSVGSWEWHAWDQAGFEYTRIPLDPVQPSPLSVKMEEWLSGVRIRSNRQMSCMLEKQCFSLKPGDWVLKENGRWRALRKSEDRQLLLEGKKVGELFILDAIDNGRKVVKGRFFSAGRTHAAPVEISAVQLKTARRRLRAPLKPGGGP